MPNIVILENNLLVGEGIVLVIERVEENKVLNISPTPEAMLLFIEKDHGEIDIAILDIELENDGYTGLDFAADLREKYPAIKIMFLTTFKRCEFIVPVFGKYEGYLYKDSHSNELRKAIKEITTPGKGTYYPSEVSQFYYECMQNKRPDLSVELIQIIKLIAQGHTNPQIAEIVSSQKDSLTENSIRERRRKLRYLLKAVNSPHMIAKAFKFGFISSEDIH